MRKERDVSLDQRSFYDLSPRRRFFEILLVVFLCPEKSCSRTYLGDYGLPEFPGYLDPPFWKCCKGLLLLVMIENNAHVLGTATTGAVITPEKFQHVGIRRHCWIKPDFDTFRMAFHIVVGRMLGITPCVPNPGLQNTRSLVEDGLRVPKSSLQRKATQVRKYRQHEKALLGIRCWDGECGGLIN